MNGKRQCCGRKRKIIYHIVPYVHSLIPVLISTEPDLMNSKYKWMSFTAINIKDICQDSVTTSEKILQIYPGIKGIREGPDIVLMSM